MNAQDYALHGFLSRCDLLAEIDRQDDANGVES